MLYQLSYEAYRWERGQFIEFMSPVRGEMMWSIYEIIHFWTAVVDLSNWKEEAWINQGINGIQTRDLRDTGAMFYQLSYKASRWERGQFVEFISPVRGEMIWNIYEIIHFWTAVVDLSNWKEEAGINQGFNGIQTRDLRDTGAMLYQLSYEATRWERGQFIEIISPVRSEMMWNNPFWLHSSVGRASHRYPGITSSNPVEALIFSDFFFSIA